MNKKDLLAKLLSTENITVLRQPVATASFNVELEFLLFLFGRTFPKILKIC